MQFRNKYYFLSNMYPCSITLVVNDTVLTFPCAESAFQAVKCPDMAHLFASNANTKYTDGYKAKKAGRRVPLRPDWEHVKIPVMAQILFAKFRQNPELEAKLLTVTGDIAEENTWRDTFWGVCNNTGQNWLGRLLMQIREYPPSKNGTPSVWLRNLGLA